MSKGGKGIKKPSQAPVKQLTLEQRMKMLMSPCNTRKDLKNWIKYHLDLEIPDKTVSRFADTNPLDVIWEMYDICVNKHNPENVQELLYVASRGAGKTLAVAVAEFMVMLHDQRDVVHVGAILSQAKRCYEYQTKFMLKDKIRTLLETDVGGHGKMLEKSNMEKTVFNLIDRFTGNVIKTSIEVLPCTLKACLVSLTTALDAQGRTKPLVDFNTGDSIKSVNGFAEIIDKKVKEVECIRLELEDGRIIEGSFDHRVWTNRGWIELQKLRQDDDILSLESIK